MSGIVCRFVLLSTLALFAVACGGETGQLGTVREAPGGSKDGGGAADATSEGGRSASRLTVQPYMPDSPRVHDEKMNVDCSPMLAADGVHRCLPVSDGVFFSDADCTRPVVAIEPDPCRPAADAGSPPATYYFTHAGGPAGCLVPKTTAFEAGAPIDPPAVLYNQWSGICAVLGPAGPGVIPQGPFYEAVPVDPSAWVELTEEIVPVTDALAVVYWKSADGARIPNGLQLRSSGSPCEMRPRYSDLPQPGTNVVPRCAPRAGAVMSSAHADDQCAGAALTASCKSNDIIEIDNGLDSSGKYVEPYGFFELGAEVSEVYFSNFLTNYECRTLPLTPSDRSHFAPVGAPLSLDPFPELTLSVEGSGRLRTQYLTSEGKNLYAESLYDTTLGMTCDPIRLSDGRDWCVSSTVFFYLPDGMGDFADSNCSIPLGLATSSSPGGSVEIPYVLLWPPGTTCPDDHPPSLHAAVEYHGPVYARSEDAGQGRRCMSSPLDPTMHYFEAGDPIDPAGVFAPIPVGQ